MWPRDTTHRRPGFDESKNSGVIGDAWSAFWYIDMHGERWFVWTIHHATRFIISADGIPVALRDAGDAAGRDELRESR